VIYGWFGGALGWFLAGRGQKMEIISPGRFYVHMGTPNPEGKCCGTVRVWWARGSWALRRWKKKPLMKNEKNIKISALA
jgi:hypothetical protein